MNTHNAMEIANKQLLYIIYTVVRVMIGTAIFLLGGYGMSLMCLDIWPPKEYATQICIGICVLVAIFWNIYWHKTTCKYKFTIKEFCAGILSDCLFAFPFMLICFFIFIVGFPLISIFI